MSDGGKFKPRIRPYWRLILIAVLFVLFGIGAMISSVLLILPTVLISRSLQDRSRRVRKINYVTFNLFTRLSVAFGIFKVSFTEGEGLHHSGQLIIANHPSLLDIVFLLGSMPNAPCVVVKKELLKNPFLIMPVYFAGYVINDDDEYFLDRCTAILRRGESLIIFPEGTRTAARGYYQFKNGAAYLMLMSDCRVRPVHISCDPPLLRQSRWYYEASKQSLAYNFSVLPELDITTVRQAGNIRLSVRSKQLTKWLANWYTQMDVNGHPEALPKLNLEFDLTKPRPS